MTYLSLPPMPDSGPPSVAPIARWVALLQCCDAPVGAARVAMLRDVGAAVMGDESSGTLATWTAIQLLDLADLLEDVDRSRVAP